MAKPTMISGKTMPSHAFGDSGLLRSHSQVVCIAMVRPTTETMPIQISRNRRTNGCRPKLQCSRVCPLSPISFADNQHWNELR